MWQPLPTAPTTLVGRSQEVAAIDRYLHLPTIRLLTLTGPGGVGKTRLALASAAAVSTTFRDGVAFVSLSPVHDPQLVLPTLAQALGVREEGERPLLGRLQTHLAARQMLLLVDNFEQVIPAAAVLAELLTACPALKLLVTSRERLHLSGEQEYPVRPLSLPNLEPLPPLADLEQVAAVALFVQRAQSLKPDFALTEANAAAVAAICTRLDGLPLALELAAARIKLLPPPTMLTRLDHRLSLLADGPHDLPDRQKSLRQTLAWSYTLLEMGEQRLFGRLGVFVSGCSLAAAEAIANQPNDLVIDVLSRVASLIDKSLLQQVEQANGEPRLTMLETVRAYALEQLALNDDVAAVQGAHAAFYLSLAETAAPHLSGPDQARWLSDLEQEHHNLRAALRWLLENVQAEKAGRLCVALWRFWFARGHTHEGRSWLAAVLDLPTFQASLGSSSDKPLLALKSQLLNGAGVLATSQGDYAVARSYCQASLVLCRQLDDRSGEAAAQFGCGQIAIWAGQYAEAAACLQESLSLYTSIGEVWGRTRSQAYLANVMWFAGEWAAAQPLFEEALAAYRSIGDQWGIAFTVYGLAFTSLSAGDVAAAAPLFAESQTILEAIGDKRGLIRTHGGLGRLAILRGEWAAAHIHWLAAFSLAHELGERWGTALCLDGMAAVLAGLGSGELAAKIFGAAAVVRTELGVTLPVVFQEWYANDLAQARALLPKADFEAAWAAGGQADIEALVAAYADQLKAHSPVSEQPDVVKAPLSPRELAVLHLVAHGLTDAEVAERLVVSVRTVHAHLQSIYNKLGVSNRMAAVHVATAQKIL